jgi:hypothetical protein
VDDFVVETSKTGFDGGLDGFGRGRGKGGIGESGFVGCV